MHIALQLAFSLNVSLALFQVVHLEQLHSFKTAEHAIGMHLFIFRLSIDEWTFCQFPSFGYYNPACNVHLDKNIFRHLGEYFYKINSWQWHFWVNNFIAFFMEMTKKLPNCPTGKLCRYQAHSSSIYERSRSPHCIQSMGQYYSFNLWYSLRSIYLIVLKCDSLNISGLRFFFPSA